jgi:Phage tail baseplate hub (GPD)
MPAPPDTPIARVRWQGHPLTGAVVSVDVEDHDRLTDRATIVVADNEGVLASVILPGHELEVEFGWGEETTIVFSGIVRASASNADREGRHLTTIVAYDKSWLLHQEAVTEDHVGTLSSIVTTIAGRHPVPVGQVVVDPDPTFEDTRPLRQHGRTDLEFLQHLAARYGARSFVERNAGNDQFYFVGAKRLLEAEPIGALHRGRSSRTLSEFRYQRVGAHAAPQVLATTFDDTTGEVKDALGAEPPPEPPLSVDPDRADAIARQSDGLKKVYETGIETASAKMPEPPKPVRILGAPADPAALDAAVVPDPTTALGLRGWGRMAGSPALRAKAKVTIDGIAPWAAGDWYLACVVHSFAVDPGSSGLGDDDRAASYETRFAVTR